MGEHIGDGAWEVVMATAQERGSTHGRWGAHGRWHAQEGEHSARERVRVSEREEGRWRDSPLSIFSWLAACSWLSWLAGDPIEPIEAALGGWAPG